MSSRAKATRRLLDALLGLVLVCGGPGEVVAQSTEDPRPAQESEKVEVNLVILDTVVLDQRGLPVTDLAREDFQLWVDNKIVPVDTFDLACGLAPSAGEDAARVAAADSVQPSIALAFDYLHLAPIERVDAIERMKAMVRREGIDGFLMMVVALTGAVRVEQPFTDDPDAVLASLDRMQNDPTLAVPDFYHKNAFGFLRGLTGMLDLLGNEPGNKAVVLFSGMQDVPLDRQFERIAAIASSSRCAIYPVDVRGLTNAEPLRRTGEDVKREQREKIGVWVSMAGATAGDVALNEKTIDEGVKAEAAEREAGCG